jgi:hypothetical protein
LHGWSDHTKPIPSRSSTRTEIGIEPGNRLAHLRRLTDLADDTHPLLVAQRFEDDVAFDTPKLDQNDADIRQQPSL